MSSASEHCKWLLGGEWQSARPLTPFAEPVLAFLSDLGSALLKDKAAKSYPGKNLITRAIGTESVVECDIFHRRLVSDECLLLCTDGLSNLVDEQEILFEIVHGGDKKTSCERLLEIAKNRGAPDNVTCVLIQG